MLRKCEIFAGANVGKFHFTSTRAVGGGRYFTISARKLFHIRRKPNISLEKYRIYDIITAERRCYYGRSATSICANIAESKYAHGRADFIAKLESSLKETNETGKWLEMLWKSDYIDETRYKTLDRKCSTIRFLLVKSITTAKNHLNTAREKNNG